MAPSKKTEVESVEKKRSLYTCHHGMKSKRTNKHTHTHAESFPSRRRLALYHTWIITSIVQGTEPKASRTVTAEQDAVGQIQII